MRIIAYLLFFTLFLGSCSSSRKAKSNLIQVPVMEKIQVNNRLVPVYIPPDSATIKALFECDSLNNVRLKELTELKSSSATTDFTFKDNTLRYRADFKKDSARVQVRDSIIEREVPVEVPVPYEVNIVTGWQWFQIWLGRILGSLLLIFIGFRIAKMYLKIPGI